MVRSWIMSRSSSANAAIIVKKNFPSPVGMYAPARVPVEVSAGRRLIVGGNCPESIWASRLAHCLIQRTSSLGRSFAALGEGLIARSADVELADLVSQECAFDHGQDVGLFVLVELVEGFEAQSQAGCFGASFVGVE